MRRGPVNQRGARRLAAALSLLTVFLLGASVSDAATSAPASTTSVRTLLLDRALPGRTQAIRLPALTKTQSTPCGQTPGLLCSTVDVPLDRTGVTPGTIPLHVEFLPAEGFQRGVLFLIAGGPGQGSAHVFGLGTPAAVSLYRFLFPGYGLVAYDDRGTGDSGLLDCPILQTTLTVDQQRDGAAACASTIGIARNYYSTFDHAEDLEAVRAALGVDKVALYGVSYGTKLAMSYALQHPEHVERLLLDSVLPPEGHDPFAADTVSKMPSKLDAFCADGGCRAATSNLSSDVAAVANRLAAKPLVGKVLLPNGSTRSQRLDGISFLSIVIDADLNPGIAAELPAVTHAARLGNTQPLLRLAAIHDAAAAGPSIDLSFALYAATVCRDGPFPWAPETQIPERQAIFNQAVAALPPGAFGPFGTWAARFGNADFCLAWPSPSGGGARGAGPLPDVPVLAVNGGIDMRTPVENAVAVVARFPQGKLLVAPGVGHSVVTADLSGCAGRAVREWMLGGAVPAECHRANAIVRPAPALPPPGAEKPKKVLGPLQTYAIATATIKEAQAIWLTAAPTTVAGIFGGKLVPGKGLSFTLTKYALARGVWISGKIRATAINLPLAFEGSVTVGGPAASTGILGLRGTSLRGTLGGRVIGK